MKRIVWTMALMCGMAVIVVLGVLMARAQTAPNQPKEKEFRIERSMPKEAVA